MTKRVVRYFYKPVTTPANAVPGATTPANVRRIVEAEQQESDAIAAALTQQGFTEVASYADLP